MNIRAIQVLGLSFMLGTSSVYGQSFESYFKQIGKQVEKQSNKGLQSQESNATMARQNAETNTGDEL